MAIPKRSLSPSAPTSQKRARTASSNPLSIKPLGNLLFNPSSTRAEGLGSLAILPDELLLSFVVSLLDGEDLVRLAGVSKAWYGWSSIEGIWKGIYISVRSHAQRNHKCIDAGCRDTEITGKTVEMARELAKLVHLDFPPSVKYPPIDTAVLPRYHYADSPL